MTKKEFKKQKEFRKQRAIYAMAKDVVKRQLLHSPYEGNEKLLKNITREVYFEFCKLLFVIPYYPIDEPDAYIEYFYPLIIGTYCFHIIDENYKETKKVIENAISEYIATLEFENRVLKSFI